MENVNIVEPSMFIFFLLVISIGYLIVEIICGDNYIFRKSISRYSGSNTIDRIIHYVIVGILFHFGLLLIFTFLGHVLFFDEILRTGMKFASGIQFIDGKDHSNNLLTVQLITSALLYFVFIIILLTSIKLGLFLVKFLAKIIDYFMHYSRKPTKSILEKGITKNKKITPKTPKVPKVSTK